MTPKKPEENMDEEETKKDVRKGLGEEEKAEEVLDDKEYEAEVLEKYLPAKMSDEELLNIIKVIIERVGAKSPSDMGKVMGVATKELAGKADGKEISAKVKQLLGL